MVSSKNRRVVKNFDASETVDFDRSQFRRNQPPLRKQQHSLSVAMFLRNAEVLSFFMRSIMTSVRLIGKKANRNNKQKVNRNEAILVILLKKVGRSLDEDTVGHYY